MLFRNKKSRCCGLCIHARPKDDDTVICIKKGQRKYEEKCLLFSYDPCKRIPAKAKAIDTQKYEEFDYSL